MLSAEELLAGSKLSFEIDVPAEILNPATAPNTNGKAAKDGMKLRLKPLTVQDLQLITRAAKENDTLVATLMVQRALVEPEMSVAEVAAMHVGLTQFLLQHVNRISGISVVPEQFSTVVEAPLVKAAFVLAKEFGWTPGEINDLTLGQVFLHLEMLKEKAGA